MAPRMPARAPGSTPSPSLFEATVTPATGFITAHCDGGARGNPGPAGYGVEITDTNGIVLAELSEFLGFRTNNFAEYSGLLASLQYALDHHHPRLRVVSDSELMVKQIQGKYKVNSPDLKPLWTEARKRIAQLASFEITHALRHKNKAADALANQAMDRGTDRGMHRRTPEASSTITNPAANGTTTRNGIQSLPLRAIPYPLKADTSPTPTTVDPNPATLPIPAATPIPVTTPVPVPTPSPLLSSRSNAEESTSPIGTPPPQTPTMLRGFTRDGVIHILGPHTLPNGLFVKIIPE